MYVVTSLNISISLPLTLLAIYGVYSLLQNNHAARTYIINLLISDLIQLCCMIVWVARRDDMKIMRVVNVFYFCSLMASIGFMVCLALERYLLISCPMWYRFRQTIKISVVVCVMVWVLTLVCVLILHFWGDFMSQKIVIGIFFLLPLPLLIFFLGGTIRALSASRVPSDEKRRIVGILVLVLLIYVLLFMPRTICNLADGYIYDHTLFNLSFVFLQLSPLADVCLYVFMRKGTIDKLLASVCCCRMDSNDSSRIDSNEISSSTM
ncbi:mas-related G-protein coupled receptor member A4-like [Sparus aurata]|uniref:mas-related G-protein coupled receptor member A4-like n=1 Tax=Sparus aurata TaxID=8175 RepID=UPI0011C19D36|nr:mas-related G-protein coupled receptor member A4-like [Sparus aurata]